jgi:hypothetical protein
MGRLEMRTLLYVRARSLSDVKATIEKAAAAGQQDANSAC